MKPPGIPKYIPSQIEANIRELHRMLSDETEEKPLRRRRKYVDAKEYLALLQKHDQNFMILVGMAADLDPERFTSLNNASEIFFAAYSHPNKKEIEKRVMLVSEPKAPIKTTISILQEELGKNASTKAIVLRTIEYFYLYGLEALSRDQIKRLETMFDGHRRNKSRKKK